MVAKLILYPDRLAQEVQPEPYSLTQPTEQRDWQWVAENLTNGKLIDLLVYLDELGFLSIEAKPTLSE